MRDYLNLGIKLATICLIAGLALGGVFMMTDGTIKEQLVQAAQLARKEVMPSADDFVLTDLAGNVDAEKAKISEVFLATKGGETIGFTVSVTVSGYKSKVILSVGVLPDGKISGMRIASQDETAGLGSRIVDESFYMQYTDVAAPIVLGNGVNAITGATISSNAVTKGVNLASDFIVKNGASLFAAK